jgi:hypothetical protein
MPGAAGFAVLQNSSAKAIGMINRLVANRRTATANHTGSTPQCDTKKCSHVFFSFSEAGERFENSYASKSTRKQGR